MAASAAAQALRQRRILVDLLLPLSADNAERWAGLLISEFSAVGQALHTSPEGLERILGARPPADMLAAILPLLRETLLPRLMDGPVLNGWQPLRDYLHATTAHRSTECFVTLFLDNRDRLMRAEQMFEGCVDKVEAHPRQVARRALEIGASAVILVHNHPSGDPTPSMQDRRLIAATITALKTVNVKVHDSIVVGSQGQVSMRAEGMM